MNAKIERFRQELNRVFDDNLRTKQWQNYVDYAIIGLIILSTVEVFLSTYSGIVERYGKWLEFVDHFTTAFFTIEVSLRIWCGRSGSDSEIHFRVLYDRIWTVTQTAINMNNALRAQWSATKIAQ